MAGSKLQQYAYASKVAGVMNFTGVPTWQHYPATGTTPDSYGLGLQLVNNEYLLTIDQLVTHFRASNITAGSSIIGIGIADGDVDPNVPVNKIPVNITPSGGVIDFSRSLSGLLLPTKSNVVVLLFNQATTLDIEVWKNDMLFTTRNAAL